MSVILLFVPFEIHPKGETEVKGGEGFMMLGEKSPKEEEGKCVKGPVVRTARHVTRNISAWSDELHGEMLDLH